MNWGKSIILAFTIFISFVSIMAYKMATAKVDLVRPNYYQTEIDYQIQIDRLKNSIPYKANEIINYSAENEMFNIHFPNDIKDGEINFYRTSDKNLDFKIPVHRKTPFQYSTKKMKKGKWKIQSIWTNGKLEYFVENEYILK